MTERRAKVYSFTESDLLEVLTGRLVVDPASFPEGAKVERVCPDLLGQCFNVVVSHPSFDPVPMNQPPPHDWDMKFLRQARSAFIGDFPEGDEAEEGRVYPSYCHHPGVFRGSFCPRCKGYVR